MTRSEDLCVPTTRRASVSGWVRSEGAAGDSVASAGLITILFRDLAGSTEIASEFGDAMGEALGIDAPSLESR